MHIVATHVARMEAELERWGSKLSELRSRGHTAGIEPNLEYHKRLDDIAVKYDAAEAKLDELKDAGNANWETLRSGIESAWAELGDAFQKLAN
jgi:hypothetical protein